ncbi:hypothetical protein CR513_20214, partial [Mucuna pruriens]
MLDKGSSNTGYAMVTRKSSQKNQPPKVNPSQRVVVENTAHILNILLPRNLTRIFKPLVRRRWTILDSGATNHMILFPSYFISYLELSKKQLITVANGDHVPIELTMERMIGIAKEQGGNQRIMQKPLNVVKYRLTVGRLKCDRDDLSERPTRTANMILA